MPKSAYNKGAKKALTAMKKTYGAKKGESIFYATANKFGRGKSAVKKANSTYGTSKKRGK